LHRLRFETDNVPAFAVDNVDASGGSVYKVIRDGEVLDPAFGPAPSYVFDLNTNVSFFKAWLSSDPYVKSYTTTATVVTAVNAYNPFDGACSYSVSGALSNSGVLAGTPATLNITYEYVETVTGIGSFRHPFLWAVAVAGI
jgi:hypothetical protein